MKNLHKNKHFESLVAWVAFIVIITLGLMWVASKENDSIIANQYLSSQKTTKVSTKKVDSSVNGIIAGIANASIFESYLNKTGVNNEISGTGPYTVFVPIDSSFGHLKAGTVSGLSATEQKRLVEYHVVPNRVVDGSVAFGTITSLSRDILNLDAKNPTKTLMVNSSKVVGSYKATNGIVYLISEVLLPPLK